MRKSIFSTKKSIYHPEQYIETISHSSWLIQNSPLVNTDGSKETWIVDYFCYLNLVLKTKGQAHWDIAPNTHLNFFSIIHLGNSLLFIQGVKVLHIKLPEHTPHMGVLNVQDSGCGSLPSLKTKQEKDTIRARLFYN